MSAPTTMLRRMPRPALLACLVAVAAAFAAPAAHAQDVRNRIFRECQDGALRSEFTVAQIKDAQRNIPDDIDQYSDCRDVLQRAVTDLTAGGSGDGSGGGPGGAGPGGADGGDGSGVAGAVGAVGGASAVGGAGAGGTGGGFLTPSTDADRVALEEAVTAGGATQEVGGRSVTPGAAGLATGAARNALPVTLVVVLALLAAAALFALAPVVRRRGLAPLAAAGPALRRRVLRRPAG